jgi:hypothetical protein
MEETNGQFWLIKGDPHVGGGRRSAWKWPKWPPEFEAASDDES